MLFGANTEVIDLLSIHTRGVTAVRIYRGDWTPMTPADFPPGLVPIVSVADNELMSIVTGAKDTEIQAFLTTLPPQTLLCVRHEANLPEYNITPLAWLGALNHVANLAAVRGDRVHVGPIYATYPVNHQGQDFGPWAFTGFCWAGIDGYQRTALEFPDNILGVVFNALHRDPFMRIVITETNSSVNVTSWAGHVADYVERRAVSGLLWFANGHPSYPNLPDTATLSDMARRCALDRV